MFVLNTISNVLRIYNWQKMQEQAHSLLPYHDSFKGGVQKQEIPLKCTFKINNNGDEMMAASSQIKNIKSRFIFFIEKKQKFIDFPAKNIRAWIGGLGNIVIKPILKNKPYIVAREKGYRKLAELHILSYLEAFKERLEL